MAEISSLLNCRTGNSVPRVRIPPSPLFPPEPMGRRNFFRFREVAQAGSAPGLGPGGRRFESCLPDILTIKSAPVAGFIIFVANL